MRFIFIGVVLIFLLASFYVASQICRAMRKRPAWTRATVWGAVILLDISFFLARLVGGDLVGPHRVLYVVSTTWMPVVLYMSLTIGAMSIARTVIRRITGRDPYRTPLTVRVGAIATAAIIAIGYYEATHTQVETYDVYTTKLRKGEKTRIALASDLHAGYSVTRKDIERLVDDINCAAPDIVVLAGDLIDGDLLPVEKEETLAPLSRLRSTLGTVAVMGNHEYMDNDQEAEKVIRSIGGLTLLRDETKDAGRLHIIGRDDLSHARAYDAPRRDIKDMAGADSLFTVVIDHQPGALDEAEDIGTDLILCGHTHGGQIWPMNIATSLIYDIDYGFGCYGGMSAVVTSGYGTWGPRMRIGTQSEIVIVDIIGTAEKEERI
ncbi:MAG: metallophosphoesterase [Marinilabiliaceae bacterium]